MTGEMDPGTLVFALRTWLDMTQEDFGQMLGVSRGRISQWETGADVVPTEMLIAMGNLCPDARGQVSRPGTPHAKDFFRLAKVYGTRLDSIESTALRIITFIRRVSPDKAQIVELQSRGVGPEEQLEFAVKMLEKVVPDVKQSSKIPGETVREAAYLTKSLKKAGLPVKGRGKP